MDITKLLLNVLFASLTLCTGDRGVAELACIPNDPLTCTCKFTDDSGIVDLRSLGNSDNTPRFKDVLGTDGNNYSFNACNGFGEGKCHNAAMCLMERGNGTQIGDAGRTMFQYSTDTSVVTAAYIVRSSVLQVSEVELICDPKACDPVFTPIGMKSVGLYSFQLTSACSCAGLCNENGPINCKDNKSTEQVFGPVIIVLIALAGVVAVYLIGGALYMKIRKNASGTDLIPNKAMWANVKLLITEGIMCTFSRCLPKKYNYETMSS